MNKRELIESVAVQMDASKAAAEKAIDAVINAITGALVSGEEARLIGFGTFVVAERAAREGRDPRTGATVQVAASRRVRFRAGKGLRAALHRP
jgi:DNA-binding protein HU-beta